MLKIKPDSELEEIIQNVQTILKTAKGTVPLLRDFGTSWQLIDQLTPELEMALKEEIFTQIEKWEKRVKVKKIKIASETENVKITLTLKTTYGDLDVSAD